MKSENIDILKIFTLNERNILQGTFTKNQKILYLNGSRKSIRQFKTKVMMVNLLVIT